MRKSPNNFKIEWASSSDPKNLILGYLLKICSTFKGSGSKIMIDGILDTQVKHVIVSNRLDKVVGKATCVYNNVTKCLFCNCISFTSSFEDKKLTNEVEREIYREYILLIKMQVEDMLRRGIRIKGINFVLDEEFCLSCFNKEEQEVLKPFLYILSYNHVEREEELFNHKESKYQKDIKKYFK